MTPDPNGTDGTDGTADAVRTAPAAVRARVIVNRGGGTAQTDATAGDEAALAELFRRHGVEASVVLVDGAGLQAELDAALAEARPGGRFEMVVAGGGDGTISAAAGALAGTDIPLGILPLGTLNHFAKDLGLPITLEDAVAAIAAGHVRDVDVAEVNGRVFVNNSSIGLYADMVADRDRQRRKTQRGKWPAMVLAALTALRRFPVRRLRVAAEGWERPCATPLLFVGNNTYNVAVPDAGARERLDAGRLCLYVVRGQGRWALLNVALRAALGRLGDGAALEMREVTAADIRTPGGRRMLRVSVDGEVTRMAQPLRYRTRPGALRVLAPPPA